MGGVKFVAPFADVLVAEDVTTNMMVMKKLLEPYQLRVTTCADGEGAIKAAAEQRYDIIFMDRIMPGMGGFEAVRLLRGTNEYNARVPVIAVSANDEPDEVYLEAGMDAFIPKPVDRHKLEAELLKWLPRYKIYRLDGRASLAPHASERSATFEVVGVDVSEGLLRSGESLEKYVELLGVYRGDGVSMINAINDAFERRDLKAYLITAMALKGASAQIGAWGLADMAGELESACRMGDHNRVQARHGMLLNLYGTVLGSIGDAVQRFFEINADNAINDNENDESEEIVYGDV